MKQQFQDTNLSLKRKKEKKINPPTSLAWAGCLPQTPGAEQCLRLGAAVAQTRRGKWLPGNHYGRLTCPVSCLECGCCRRRDRRGHQDGRAECRFPQVRQSLGGAQRLGAPIWGVGPLWVSMGSRDLRCVVWVAKSSPAGSHSQRYLVRTWSQGAWL